MVSAHHAKKVDFDFVISFDESDDEDYTFTYDKNSFSYKLVSVNDLKSNSDNNDNKIHIEISSEDVPIKSSDDVIDINVNTYSNALDKNIIWHNYLLEIRDTHSSDTRDRSTLTIPALTEEIDQAITDRLRIKHTDAQMLLGFGAYSADSSRVIASEADLKEYWTGISSTGDFLTTVLSYTAMREPLRRLCHHLIAFTIAGRGQAPDKVNTTDLYYLRSMDEGTVNVSYLLAQYLFRHVEGRKKGAKMFGGYFITHLAEHFRLLTKKRLQGLTMVIRDLTKIDMDELVRL
ncbi:hypothetical protein Tco_0371593 [Tanacetum coccineum]